MSNTYYLHPLWGNDSDDGLSRANAWKSLDFVRNGPESPFTAGDTLVILQSKIIGEDAENLGRLNIAPGGGWVSVIAEGQVIVDFESNRNLQIGGHILIDGVQCRNMKDNLFTVTNTDPFVLKNCILNALGSTNCGPAVALDMTDSATVYPDNGAAASGVRIERCLFIGDNVGGTKNLGLHFKSAQGLHTITHCLQYRGDDGVFLELGGGEINFNSNIVAGNEGGGLTVSPSGSSSVKTDFNCFWDNDGTDMVGLNPSSVGNIQQDPGFRYPSGNIFYISDSTSPVVGAGGDGQTMGPYGFGSWEHHNIAGGSNWDSDWNVVSGPVSYDGATGMWTLLDHPTEKVGVLVSPVYNFGEVRYVRRVITDFISNENFVTGDRHVMDSNNATLKREIEYRFSNDPFNRDDDPNPLSVPDWNETAYGEIIGADAQYFQVRITLRVDGV